MRKITVNNQEIAIEIKANEVQNIYTKGSYWIFFGKTIEKYQVNEIIDTKYHSLFLADETIDKFY